jgi:uncharacterized protein YeaO (DUF488 family)
MFVLKRIYEPYSKDDGFRILVDRLWPRGVSKNKAKVDLWLKEIGPSHELRKWFGHKTDWWIDFKKKYQHELAGKKDLLDILLQNHKEYKKVTVEYAAKDKEHNDAIVIIEVLAKHAT